MTRQDHVNYALLKSVSLDTVGRLVGIFVVSAELADRYNSSGSLLGIAHYTICLQCFCLQCFDTVGWAAGRASGL